MPKISPLGQKLWPTGREHTDTHTDRQTEKVNTEDPFFEKKFFWFSVFFKRSGPIPINTVSRRRLWWLSYGFRFCDQKRVLARTLPRIIQPGFEIRMIPNCARSFKNVHSVFIYRQYFKLNFDWYYFINLKSDYKF